MDCGRLIMDAKKQSNIEIPSTDCIDATLNDCQANI
jgi:hypothetical protein